jgi:hypothetical protein
VGDPDGDGVLELVVTDQDGRIHIFTGRGTNEVHWPQSVWHPDVVPFSRVASGPILVDVTGDGRSEILQGSGDGTLHAFQINGSEAAGWPLAAGYPLVAGPLVAGLGEEGELQTLAVDAAGYATLLDLALPAREEAAGEMWRSDGGPARTHCYPRARLPVPVGSAVLLDERSVIFTPNPVRSKEAVLRYRMGRPGTLRMTLFDTSGQRVWQGSRTPESITEESVWPFGVGDLASGLYVARITAQADGEESQLLRKLAIVR